MDLWRIQLRLRTGWSSEVIDAIRSKEEAEIYVKAGLKEKTVNGRPALVNPAIVGAKFQLPERMVEEAVRRLDEMVGLQQCRPHG